MPVKPTGALVSEDASPTMASNVKNMKQSLLGAGASSSQQPACSCRPKCSGCGALDAGALTSAICLPGTRRRNSVSNMLSLLDPLATDLRFASVPTIEEALMHVFQRIFSGDPHVHDA